MADTLNIADDIINGRSLRSVDASALWASDFIDLLSGANKIREHFKGKNINLCSIINAKSGACSENCAFCAQFAKHKAKVEKYPLVSSNALNGALETAVKNQAGCFGIVTSGKALSENEVEKICGVFLRIKAKAYAFRRRLANLSSNN